MISKILLLDNPKKFFRLKKSLPETFAYIIIFLLFFSSANDVVLRAGFVKNVVPLLPQLKTVTINVLSGFLLVVISSAVLSVLFRKKFAGMLSVVVHSLTPLLLFGWVPFFLFTFATLLWSLFFMVMGLKIKTKMKTKTALTSIFVLLIISAVALAFYMQLIMPMVYFIS
jgi:hypothetical protein